MKSKITQSLPTAVNPLGACGLCIGNDKKRVWTVQSAVYSGDVCDAHMEILVRNGKPKEAEPTLFDGRTG